MSRTKKQPTELSTNAQSAADKIVIETGIPIPEGNRYGQWTLVAAKMNVGNSVFVKEETIQRSTQKIMGLKNALRKAGKDCITRTMEGGVRIWCTKAPKKPKDNPETPKSDHEIPDGNDGTQPV